MNSKRDEAYKDEEAKKQRRGIRIGGGVSGIWHEREAAVQLSFSYLIFSNRREAGEQWPQGGF